MSDISCEIIKDLLPLYADDICSQDSKNLVEEHIKNCSDCSDELEKITNKNAEIRPATVDGEELRRVGKKFKKTKKRAVIKGVVIGLVAVILIGILLIPDLLVVSAIKSFGRNNVRLDTIEMNIKNQMDGKVPVGNVKINLPEGYNIEKYENDELTSYKVVVSDSTDDNPKYLTIRFVKSDKEVFNYDIEHNGIDELLIPGKIVNWFEKAGIKRLGFNTEDGLEEYLYYLCSAEEPEYKFFSSFGKKAEVFAYYYGYIMLMPISDKNFYYDNEQYKSYGFNKVWSDEEGQIHEYYGFVICEKGITIDFIGPFEKSEVESIMSSIVLE